MRTYSLMGERCTGTNWLDLLISRNFEIENSTYPGFKHWPTFDMARPPNHLTIFSARNALDWLNSFYRTPHHVRRRSWHGLYRFIYDTPFKTLADKKILIKEDMNLEKKQFYKDLLDLRKTKHLYWMKKEPMFITYSSGLTGVAREGVTTSAKPNLWVRYEDVLADPARFVNFLENQYGLKRLEKPIDIIDQYKDEVNKSLNKNDHRMKQFFWNPATAVSWLRTHLEKHIVRDLLQQLISSEFETQIGYDKLYKEVLVMNETMP